MSTESPKQNVSPVALSKKAKVLKEKIAQLSRQLKREERESETLAGQTQQLEIVAAQLYQIGQIIKNGSMNAPEKDEVYTMDGQGKKRNLSDQSELIDELTVKLQEVELKLASATLQNTHAASQNIVKTHMLVGMTLGLLPAPLFDVAALTGTQVNMLRSLCKHYDMEFDEQLSKVVATSLLAGSLPVMTVIGLSSFAKVIPGIGTVGGGISMTALAGAIIHATGQVFIRHFESGGTLKDFDAKHWQIYFKEQLREGKVYIKNKLDMTGASSPSEPNT